MNTTPRTIHVELHLDESTGPISGVLESAGGRERFAGWLELTAALERARTARAKAPTPA
jgi:hypothetical protein